MDAIKIIKNISKEAKKVDTDYNTGLLNEKLIVASYNTMSIYTLEKMRFLMNKIIKKKKEILRQKNASSNSWKSR